MAATRGKVGTFGEGDAKRLGRVVRAFEKSPRSNVGPPLKHKPNAEAEGRRRLLIFGNRTCGGAYAAYVTTNATAAFDSTQPTYNTAAIAVADTSQEVTFVNLNEQGTAEHSLTQTPITVVLVWADLAGVDDQGRPVYQANAVDLVDCA
jgi:hypothetical protein